MKTKQLIMKSQNVKDSTLTVKQPNNKIKKITQLGQPYKKDEKINPNQLKQLQKQNYRLIQSNLKLLVEAIQIVTIVKEDLLRVALFLSQYHYLDATKAVYELIQKVQKFKQSHTCQSNNHRQKNYQKQPINPQSSKFIQKARNLQLQRCSVIHIIQPTKSNIQPKIGQFEKNIFDQQNEFQGINNVSSPLNLNEGTNWSAKNEISLKQIEMEQSMSDDKNKQKIVWKKKSEPINSNQDLFRMLLCQSIEIEEHFLSVQC